MAIDDEMGPPTREEHEEMQFNRAIAKAFYDAAIAEQERMKDPVYRTQRALEDAERSRIELNRLAKEQRTPAHLLYVKYTG